MNIEDIQELLGKVNSDPRAFISRLKIKDKKGKLVPFILNKQQEQLLDVLCTGKPVVVIKARQLGITTLVAAYLFWKAYTSKEPIDVLSILHKQDAADEVFLKHKEFLQSIPELLRGQLRKETASYLRFDDNGASIQSTTAGGHGGTRSKSLHLAHISELCFYTDPEEVISNVIASLNENQVVIESTCKQYGDPMHKLIQSIRKDEREGWQTIFFPWYEHEEYTSDVPEDFVIEPSEKLYKELYKLTDGQVYWRRKKLSEIGLTSFMTEYPASEEDIFAQKGDAYYTADDLKDLYTFQIPNIEENILEEPLPRMTYGIGVDVAAGVGKDHSVIYVLDKNIPDKKFSKPVYIYSSNRLSSDGLAYRIQQVSAKYNNAWVLVEANNYGHAVLNELRNLGFNKLWTKDGKPWETTSKSKLLMHEELKTNIRKGIINVIDYPTLCELKALTMPSVNKAPESIHGEYGHSDRVMALGLAWQCLKDVPSPQSYIDSKRTFKPAENRFRALAR